MKNKLELTFPTKYSSSPKSLIKRWLSDPIIIPSSKPPTPRKKLTWQYVKKIILFFRRIIYLQTVGIFSIVMLVFQGGKRWRSFPREPSQQSSFPPHLCTCSRLGEWFTTCRASGWLASTSPEISNLRIISKYIEMYTKSRFLWWYFIYISESRNDIKLHQNILKHPPKELSFSHRMLHSVPQHASHPNLTGQLGTISGTLIHFLKLLLMVQIPNNHLGCIKPCK